MTGLSNWELPELPTGQIIAGNYVRYLRDNLGLRNADVCGLAGLSHTSMSRTESGARPLSQEEAETLLAGPYQVPESGRRGFARFLSETACAVKHREMLPLAMAVDHTTGWPDRLAALEHRATKACVYAQRLVPAFLRTPGYSTRIIDQPDPIDLQITRPAAIGTRTTVVLEESVLMRLLGAPHLFAEQMTYLIGAVAEQLITVRVLPLDSAVHGEFPEHLAEFLLPNGAKVYAAESDHATYYSGLTAERRMGGFLARVTEASLSQDESLKRLRLARDKALGGDRLRLP
ncbi:Scr1 family TA system antitoxin-like transcriptional regulator [Streptomyces sp. NPDC001890]|uniref:Scr1 family TA system antitoxin-like transcriptional regulator n=1 Tax=Streptomyces sp. NPDC001890 TaxID=3364620 RepID=UPI0036C356AD